MPAGYTNRLHEPAKVALEQVDGPSRGGHNPRGLAATASMRPRLRSRSWRAGRRLFSQREAAECVQVAEYTVREQYVEMFKSRMGLDTGGAAGRERARAVNQSTEMYRIPPVSPSALS